jgi:inorganic phosphate transporter, PiT family
MTDIALASPALTAVPKASRFDSQPTPLVRFVYCAILLGGIAYAGLSFAGDTSRAGETIATGTLIFLSIALLIALGFEFVNGFHDTANAVATVIYTNAMPAPVAVVWSGVFNFLGVMLSSGTVAYAIIALLPVELILNVGSGAGYAMILALLLAAVLWNLATWAVGLPNSSSHTLIGSILGVGLANQLMTSSGPGGGVGVDWAQVQKILTALLVSPMIGFLAALLLIIVMRRVLRNPALFTAPVGDAPPSIGIRALLIATCSAVSFTHGSNDGQKGMGLIMLILIGCAPTAYALNRSVASADTPAFIAKADAAAAVFASHAPPVPITMPQARAALKSALQARRIDTPSTEGALAVVAQGLSRTMAQTGSLALVRAADTSQLRNDMVLALDTGTLAMKRADAEARYGRAGVTTIKAFNAQLETATRFIPLWVKIAVAIALGLGTMIGWKRIVITVGEKIGKSEFTYAMGAVAELVTAITIRAADAFGVPVSTTHILTSGVAGAAVGQGQGLNFRTVRNMAAAWVITLPVTMALSGGLYWLFLTMVVTR